MGFAARLPLILACLAVLAPAWAAADDSRRSVSALGRIEPRDGVVQVSGPSGEASVIAELLVAEGDRDELDQPLAVLDRHALSKAEVDRLEAELANAEREAKRIASLYARGATSVAERDKVDLTLRVAEAMLAKARAELDLSVVRAPIPGQVIEIHARRGERVGSDGLCELARTDEMYAVAEVYETDIGRVEVGQRAEIRSPALAEDLHGRVERIGLKVGKLDIVDTDPAAMTAARVVEVDIRLDDGSLAAGLTNLQVEVEIRPGTDVASP